MAHLFILFLTSLYIQVFIYLNPIEETWRRRRGARLCSVTFVSFCHTGHMPPPRNGHVYEVRFVCITSKVFRFNPSLIGLRLELVKE